MQIVAQKFTHAGFKAYLDGIVIPNWAKFIVVHNTSAPDIKLYNTWQARQGKWKNWSEQQWLNNLTSYYAGMGWNGCPHLFIPPTPDTILVLNSLRVHGVHTPSWNSFSVGVETVGEFESERFEDPTRANLVAALAMLHEKLGLQPLPYALGRHGLHFHKEDHATTHKTCPGRNMVKTALVQAVVEKMGGTMPETPLEQHHDVPISSQEADTVGMSIAELTSVKQLQTWLNAWNTKQPHPMFTPLTVDGVRGQNTKGATSTFQQTLGLVVDGVAGPVTRSTLKKFTA